MTIQAAPTVRESIEAAVETVVPADAPAPVDTPAPQVDAPIAAAPVVEETEAQKAERLRNKDGTFAKGKAEAKVEAPKVDALAPVVAPKPKAPRPTSWKKDLEPQWETMAPEVQAYINEREKQYATGVSTYKTEADRAKTVMQAVAQFEPMLQRMNIPPEKWIQSLGIAHHFLSGGTAQEKVQTVADIIRNNRVDAQALMQVLSGQQPQYQQPQGQPTPLPQAQQQPQDLNAAVAAEFDKRNIEAAYKSFTDDVAAGKYPHFADEEVKGTMAGLLQAGLAQDYPSAYEAAIALPKHKHLVAAVTPAPAPALAPAVDKQAQATRARSQAVSVKSSTPSAMAPATGPKGLRDSLSENFDKVTATRV